MESELLYMLELAKANAGHIAVLNGDYTSLSVSYAALKAQVDIIMWFIAINVVAWVGLVINIMGKKLLRNNGSNNANR